MPKAELHIHLKGATRPETLLKLAQRNHIDLPAHDLAGLRDWFRFRDAMHFFDVYDLITECFCTPDDIELAMREFIEGQAAQNIRYTEITYTPRRSLPFDEQLDALNRARTWGESTHNTRVNIVIDIPRELPLETGVMLAEWAISGIGRGVVGFGLGGGPETVETTRKFARAFAIAKDAGLPRVPHAGEAAGPESMWAAIHTCEPVRIGHGVQCLADSDLVTELKRRDITLEVCPTSNVCLRVVNTLAGHPLPRLLDAGLSVTLGSDDPPMFNTTLTDEYIRCANTFGFDRQTIIDLNLNGLRKSLLPAHEKSALLSTFEEELAL